MNLELKRDGQRLYFVGNTYPYKDSIKAIGGKWDGDKKAWWVGVAKIAEAEKLLQELAISPPKQEDPSKIRLTGKGRYKGRDYYAGSITKDGTKVRLLTLPDKDGKYLDFWALCSEVEQIKTYPTKEYRGRTEYTTLGSIASFIERQKNPSTAVGECTECGGRGRRGETCQGCYEGTFV